MYIVYLYITSKPFDLFFCGVDRVDLNHFMGKIFQNMSHLGSRYIDVLYIVYT